MRITDTVHCADFPCGDVIHSRCSIPYIELSPENVRIVMISECAAANPTDGYYCGGESLFQRTTLQAFKDAGAAVSSFQDILDMGVYLTPAVKCGKTGYGIATGTVKACSHLLEAELALFPKAAVYLLMGDVAIKAVNHIATRQGAGRVIPAGSTYKIRGASYTYRGIRAIPSYLQAGPAFFIEKSKRQMIAEDIRSALSLASGVA